MVAARFLARALALPAAALAIVLATAAPAPGASVHRHARTAWTLTATAPADHDITVTRADFTVPAHDHSRVRASFPDPAGFGTLFTAAGVLRDPTARGKLTVLVVLVNRRPRAALYPDLASVRLILGSRSFAARPRLAEITNPLATGAQPAAALCHSPSGAPLVAADISRLAARGTRFGFSSVAVIANGFDLACGRAADPAFTAAVTADSGCPPCAPSTTMPCPLAAAAIACPAIRG